MSRPVAEMLTAHGYHAFVLNDRHGSGLAVRQSMVRGMDLQRAIRIIRAHADDLMVNPNQIVTFGMSMGNRPTIDLHIYDGISHGFDMGDFKYYREEPFVQLQKKPTPYVQSVAEWPHLLFLWLDRVLAENYGYQWPIGHFDPGNKKGRITGSFLDQTDKTIKI